MMRVHRRAAAFLGAVTIAGTAGMVALAPTAFAGEVTMTATCQVPVLGQKVGPQTIKVDFDKTSGQAGDTVTATVDLGPPPITSPANFANAKAQSTLKLKMTGSATGSIELAGPEVTLDIVANVPIDPQPYTATFTIPASAGAGKLEFTPEGTANVTDLPGLGKQTAPCTYAAASGPTVVASITTEAGEPGAVTLGVTPSSIEQGKQATVSGANWPAGTPTVALCKGAECKDEWLGAKDVKNEGGNLSGTVTVAATTPVGDYTVKVTSGTGAGLKEKTAPLKVTAKQVAQPEITITPATGKVGTEVTVSGKNWDKSKDIFVSAVAGTTPVGAPVSAKTDANGEFKDVKIKVADKTVTAIGAAILGSDGKPVQQASAAFTVAGDDPVIKDPNGKPVEIKYSCLTADSPIESAKGPFESTREVTILLPSAGNPNEEVDVSLRFKDDVIGDMPNIPITGVKLKITPSIDVKITDDAGGTGKMTLNAATPPEFDLVPGQPMKAGPFTGKFKIPGGGTFSFIPDQLRINTEAIGSTTHTVCTVKNSPAVSATLKAEGPRGQLPSTTGGTTTGSANAGATSGDLAKTGSGGSTINAFALAAGTAVLAAVGVLLMVGNRRRVRARS